MSPASDGNEADRGFEATFDAVNSALVRAPLPGPASGIDPAPIPLIYVVGVPRAGTTLASQVLARALDVGYVNNLIARFWLRPSVGIRLSRVLGTSTDRGLIDLGSTWGETMGAAGPHEFGHFWTHWLRLADAPTHRLDGDHLARLDAAGLRGALEQEILAEFAGPVVLRNPICGLQARFLASVHPASLFVHVTRDPLDVCLSLLRARRDKLGSEATWWSVRPGGMEIVPDDPVDQVVRQVTDTRSQLDTELDGLGQRSLAVAYQDLCASPEMQVRLVSERVRELFSVDIPLLWHPTALMPQEHRGDNPELTDKVAARLFEARPTPIEERA
ncbi:MAG: sulfotransferase [Actinomycetota bacterium]|nr:sulfotransferase [Actinomycetota bacterium]